MKEDRNFQIEAEEPAKEHLNCQRWANANMQSSLIQLQYVDKKLFNKHIELSVRGEYVDDFLVNERRIEGWIINCNKLDLMLNIV